MIALAILRDSVDAIPPSAPMRLMKLRRFIAVPPMPPGRTWHDFSLNRPPRFAGRVPRGPDTRLPCGGHDLRVFQMQTPIRSTSDSGVTHANCESPCVHDPRRVRASPDRTCRQSRGPHRRKGRDGGECMARRASRSANLDQGPRWQVACLNHQVRAERLKRLGLATDATFRDKASPQPC
jgi:hypothetical protein